LELALHSAGQFAWEIDRDTRDIKVIWHFDLKLDRLAGEAGAEVWLNNLEEFVADDFRGHTSTNSVGM
jgi:hypothetical protein